MTAMHGLSAPWWMKIWLLRATYSAHEACVQTHVTFGRHEPTLALYHARLGDISVLQSVEGMAVRRKLGI